ncbi:MAG: YdcF family protein [bacterium]
MRRWAAVGAFAVLATVYLGRHVVLQAVGDFLVVNDPLVRADAIIAIGGNGPERVATSAALLRQGYGEWLILSGGPYGQGQNSLNELRDHAAANGVSPDRILADDGAESTVGNARASVRLMKARGLRTAILVTSPYHTRRAAVTFSRIFRAEGLDVRVRAADNSFFKVQRWWTGRGGRDLVLREYVKLLISAVFLP